MLNIQKFSVGNFGTNCYFLIDDKTSECFIVDPGADFEYIDEKVTSKGLIPKGILLTHAHFDHVISVNELKEKYNIPVYIHKDENDMLTDPDKNMLSLYAKGIVCSDAEFQLEDGDTINLGNNIITIMHTPGHTPGSACYLFDKSILTGDTLFYDSIGRYDFPGGDYKTIIASLKKIKNLEGDYKLYPGHGPATTLDREKSCNMYLM